MKPGHKVILAAVFYAMRVVSFAESLPEQPLPPLEAVLDGVLRRAEKERDNDRSFRQRYRFTRSRVTEYRDSDGDLKKRQEKTSVNNPTAAPAASPAPLPTARPKAGEPDPKGTAQTSTEAKLRGRAYERSDFAVNEDLLQRFDFILTGRESLNGRSVLMLEFKPAMKKPPEKDFKDRFINKAAGRLWIDEVDYALAKADLHLTEPVKLIGGLVGNVRKLRYTFERGRTADGLWFARAVQWHLEGRELFVRRVIDYRESRTEVRSCCNE